MQGCFVESDGRDKVASGPETAAGKLLVLLLDPSTGFDLNHTDCIGHRVFGWDNEIQVDMFVSDVPALDHKVFPAADQLEQSLEFLFNILIGHNSASILWSPNQVVLTDVCAMIKFVQLAIHKNHLLSSLKGGDFIIWELTLSLQTHSPA